jgi:hypothetical protein
MTRCPFRPYSHDAVPDPASLGLGVGAIARCGYCSQLYAVTSTTPYHLARSQVATGDASIARPVLPPGTRPGTRRVLNCLPSRNTERDWRPGHAAAAGALAATTLPLSVDLREAWWEINDQQSTGSCVGWATADSLLRWSFVKRGRLAEGEQLSPRFIWMASKETDEFRTRPTTFIDTDGTSLKAALDVGRKYGAVRERLLPFGGALYPDSPDSFYAAAAELKIASYFNLHAASSFEAAPASTEKFRNWKRWLASEGPIVARLEVDATWDDATATRGVLDEFRHQTARGGHAVAIVGFRQDGRFIVRNSWGTAWGDYGYAYASPAYADEAFTETYGVRVE